MEENSPIHGAETSDGAGEKFSPQKTGPGAIVGVIIIIILLALGVFYLLNARPGPTDNPPPLILGNDEADAEVSSDAEAGLPPQSSSDEAAAITADLEAMNIDRMNSETNADMSAYAAESQ